jgi:hypothetical protein
MGKSPFFMGKSTISMAIFNSFLYVYWRISTAISPSRPTFAAFLEAAPGISDFTKISWTKVKP